MTEDLTTVRDLLLTGGGIFSSFLALRWLWTIRREMRADRAAERAAMEEEIEGRWRERADVAGRLADLERTFETAVKGWRRTRTRTRKLFDAHAATLDDHETRLRALEHRSPPPDRSH